MEGIWENSKDIATMQIDINICVQTINSDLHPIEMGN